MDGPHTLGSTSKQTVVAVLRDTSMPLTYNHPSTYWKGSPSDTPTTDALHFGCTRSCKRPTVASEAQQRDRAGSPHSPVSCTSTQLPPTYRARNGDVRSLLLHASRQAGGAGAAHEHAAETTIQVREAIRFHII